MKSNAVDILPSLSLSRRPPKKKELSVVDENETKHNLKRPSIPIPSFQAERENLKRIFDSESDESPLLKKKSKKRKRSSVPIPSFSSADDDVFDDSDILDTKPIFAADTRKIEQPKESFSKENQKNVAANDLSVATPAIKTTASESPSNTTETKEGESAKSISVSASNVDSACQTKENTFDRDSGVNHDLLENDIMQLAVGIARNLDPITFDFKQVQQDLQVQTGDAWKRVKLAKLRQFVLQQLEPTEEALHAAIDTVFLATDIESSTKKQFIAQVQKKFPIPFSQLCRTKITRRLTSLLNKETSPTVVAMANRDSIENSSLMPPLADKIDSVVTVINDAALTDSAAPIDNTASNEMVDPTDDRKLLSALCCESTLNERGLRDLPCDVPTLPDKTNRDRDCNVATSVVSETASSSSEDKMAPARARKARKTAKTEAAEKDADFSRAAIQSPPEKNSRKRKTPCQLCVNCPCSLSIDQSKASLSEKHSDAAVERNLIKRLQKLEKIADYCEEQTDSVRRLLKKHRRDIWKKREASRVNSKECANRPRFLPDAGELGEVMDSIKPRDPVGPERSRKAQVTVFARAPVVAQSTLTQLLGGVTKTTKGREIESSLDDIADETEVDLKDEDLPTSDGEDEKDGASTKSFASEEEAYRERDAIPYSRVECVNGREHMRSPTKDGEAENSMWISMLTGKFSQCLTDLIDNSEDIDDCSKLDDLFEMIDGSNDAQDEHSCVNHGDAVELSMLSQRGQNIAQSLIESTKKDTRRSSTLDRRCPQWKENILYALHQRNSDDIVAALEQLKSEQSILNNRKALLSRAIDERTDLLNLYEKALKASLSRFSGGTDEVIHQGRELFSPSKAKDYARPGHGSENLSFRCSASQCGMSSPLSVSSRLE
ncbi:hypothetical protein FisN_10Hu004 [Fistulifera solaris]|uniref:Uncharacterized protein n=1 Tax=Fistulifera solaris TaxID=1519565 RepID=A0A1Z5K5D7_FISSO|nr:hypothetical protein FisN_10Hu004 [Fistulifera solaris]|eukprot:GAX21426.1 hypothetical protein FisN_10Hu004 [Fistulifera solaris]